MSEEDRVESSKEKKEGADANVDGKTDNESSGSS